MSATPDEPTANFKRTKWLADLIRSQRTKLGLSREGVTKLTGVSVHALYLIESGKRRDPNTGEMTPYKVGTGTLVKLARALKITPAQLEAVKRPDAAVDLLTDHLQSGGLNESDKQQLIRLLRKLSAVLPYAETIEFVGIATGQLIPPSMRPDDDE